MSEDGGGTWRKIERIAGVPERTYVSFLHASPHDANTVYAAFDNHKMADFKPYVYRSTDRGRNWSPIANGLPANGPVYAIAQDHVDADLLFVGTEFGVHTSTDGGGNWTRMKSGLPTIAVKDLVIQKRESDLVLGTFGRSFYVLDDYSPLRDVDAALLDSEARIFPVKDALMYIEATHRGIHSQGETFFTSKNPPYGATVTYYLKESVKTLKEKRLAEEKKLRKDGKTPPYPDWETLRREDDEIAPYLLFTFRDAQGNALRKLTAKAAKGIQRITWNLRLPDLSPVSKNTDANKADGMLVPPGTYSVELALVANGTTRQLAGPVNFTARVLDNATLPAADRGALADFHRRLGEIQRVALGMQRFASELSERIERLDKAIAIAPDAGSDLRARWNAQHERMLAIQRELNGDEVIGSRNGAVGRGVVERIQYLMYFVYRSTSAPAAQHLQQAEDIVTRLTALRSELRSLADTGVAPIEAEVEALGGPMTPGRLPELR